MLLTVDISVIVVMETMSVFHYALTSCSFWGASFNFLLHDNYLQLVQSNTSPPTVKINASRGKGVGERLFFFFQIAENPFVFFDFLFY